ncbi:hypothetical protein Tco_0245720 [Tanacetum coccineum]
MVGWSMIRRTSEKELNEVKFNPYGLELITSIHATTRVKVDLVKSSEVFLRRLEEGLRSSFRSSRSRKVVINEGDKWFKYLDEKENMEKHGG